MIERIDFRFGPGPGQPPISFAPGPMTVFVGPNNGGKSIALEDVRRSLDYIDPMLIGLHPMHAGQKPKLTVLQDLRAAILQPTEIEALFSTPWNTDDIFMGPLLDSEDGPVGSTELRREEFDRWRTRPDPVLMHHLQLGARRRIVLVLRTRDRLRLLRPRPAGDMRLAPRNIFQALFRDDDRRLHLSDEVNKAFGLYFVLDNLDGAHLRAAFHAERPDPKLERSRSEEALDFFRRSIPVEEVSDGVNAYTGILASVLCADQKVILIDEPEAFLAPTLSRRLGHILSDLASKRQGNVIVATHSADFLFGCVESGQPVNIVRLTFDRKTGEATARLLSADRLKTLMRDPYLRSTGMLGALFHKGAVVGESDADRAFYAEINERLMTVTGDGIDDCVFLNGHNWQSLKSIVGPLREIGIPAAAVVDLDVVKTQDLADLMEAAGLPPSLRSGLGYLRAKAYETFKKSGVEPRDGLDQLSVHDRACPEQLIRALEDYGIFVVPVGELERWLAHLGVNVSKPNWLPAMFEKMGSDPDTPSYSKPTNNDVWAFVRKIGEWIRNPNRKGMPIGESPVPLTR